ncbi:MAG: SGNH/GDSL hydrolase family protein [Labilithrix sp.]|nr:SGNH/GDSL hydrolase family protein [Labilithrix sp.]
MARPLTVASLAVLALVSGCSRRAEPAPPTPKESSSVTTLSGAVPAASGSGAAAEGAGAAPAATAEAAPVPRSLAGKKVLHVGDSMVGGTFGLTRALEAKLSAEGAKLVRHTTVSESLVSFDKTPTLRDLLRTHDPDIVVITLGANDANVPYPEAYARNVDNIVRRVGNRECWWIGPPSIKNVPGAGPSGADMGIVGVIEAHAGGCRFFDSSKLELERTSDGIHPNDRAAAKWADAFWQVFRPETHAEP